MRRHSLEGTFFYSTISFNGKVYPYPLRSWSYALKAGPAMWKSLTSFSRARGLLAANSFFIHSFMILAFISCNM